MDIVIDFSTIPTDSPISFGWWFFKTIGWIIPVFLFIWAILLFWQAWIRNNYRKTRKYIILAIDIPKDNEQGPKAVENIFNQLAGAHQRLKFHEKWWTGEIPDSFSFEIVSIGGYIQFLVHLEERFRDLVEAMIYAQYTDAEIVEVEDYTKDWNFKFPNDKYDLWGTELKLGKKEYYPIRTYPEFEHIAEGYKDSMAGILEALTRIGPGEQIWIQIVTTPADNDWGEGAEPLIAKLIGAKDKTKKKWFDYIFDIPNIVVDAFNPPAEAPARTGPPEPPTQMLHMTEGQKFAVSAIEKKNW